MNSIIPTIVLLCVMSFVLNSAIQTNASAVRNKRATLTEEAERIMGQVTSIDVSNVGQLIELVEKNGADECLTRVICELTQNGRSHGDAGIKFAQSLMKFRQSKHAKVKRYTDAMSFGAKAKDSNQCKSKYSRCSHSTQEVITVGNKVLSRA